MTAEPPRDPRTPRERAALRRYAVELAVVVGVLLVLVLLPVDAIAPGAGDGLRVLWAVLPVAPVLGLVLVVARYVRRVDELQRRVVLESLAIGFAAAMITALTAAFLRSAGVAVGDVEWAVFGVGMLSFGVAVTVRTWWSAR